MPSDTPPGARTPRVAVVDDDPRVLEALADLLQASGYDARVHASAEAFIASTPPTNVDLLLSDVGLPGMNGVELIRYARSDAPALPAILVTGRRDAAIAEQARTLGVPLFEKPFDASTLLATVARLLGL